MAQRPTSTGLINLQNFLDLNQSGGEQLGQRIAQGVNDKSTQAESQIQGLNTAFNQQAQAGTAAAPDLTGLSTEEKKKKLAEAAAATYKGPMSLEELENYGGVASATSDVARTGAGLGNENGRAEAIRGTTSGAYSGSQNAADAFLAGQSTGGKAALTGAQTRASGLKGFLTGQTQTSRDSAKTAQESVKRMSEQAQKDLAALNQPRTEPLPRNLPGRPQGYKGDQLEANGVEYDANGRRTGINGPRSSNPRRGGNYDRDYIP